MNFNQKYYTILAMKQFGRGFIRALALALEAADVQSTAKIEAAFPEVVEHYGPGSRFYSAVGGQHE